MAKGKKNTAEGNELQSVINYTRNRINKLEEDINEGLRKQSEEFSQKINEIKKRPSWLWAILQFFGAAILLASWWFQNKELAEVSERKTEAIRRLSDLARLENSALLADLNNDVLKQCTGDTVNNERRAKVVTTKLIFRLDGLKEIYRHVPVGKKVGNLEVTSQFKDTTISKLQDWLTDVHKVYSYGSKYIDTLDYYDKLVEDHVIFSIPFVDIYRDRNAELAQEEYFYSNLFIFFYILGSMLLILGSMKDYF